MRRALCAIACLALAAGQSSCLSAEWQRSRNGKALDASALSSLPESGATLEACLAALGAPEYVWEHNVHGLALIWAWSTEQSIGGTVSIPIYRSQSASVKYTDVRLNREGVVLWFDSNWILESRRAGYLNEFITSPRHPATIDQIEQL